MNQDSPWSTERGAVTKSPEPAHGQRVQMACVRVPRGVEDLGPEDSEAVERVREGPGGPTEPASGTVALGVRAGDIPSFPPHETAALCCFREARPY